MYKYTHRALAYAVDSHKPAGYTNVYIYIHAYTFTYMYTYINVYRAPVEDVESHKPLGCIFIYKFTLCLYIQKFF